MQHRIYLLLILLFEIELPYVIYKPGSSINLNDRIEIEGGYESEGTLEMAYVSLVKGSIPFLGIAAIHPSWDIAPKEEVATEEESIKEALERDKLYYKEAIDNATIVAYKAANKSIEITNIINNVIYITDEAETTLKEYDQIIEVDNTRIIGYGIPNYPGLTEYDDFSCTSSFGEYIKLDGSIHPLHETSTSYPSLSWSPRTIENPLAAHRALK